jgi:hypothetical protein
MRIVKRGESVHGLLPTHSGVRLFGAVGEYFQAPDLSLNICIGECSDTTLRAKDNLYIGVANVNPSQDLMMLLAQRGELGQFIGDVPYMLRKHRRHPHRVDAVLFDHV